MYDAGDFIDDYAVDPYLRNDRSFLFFVEISKKGIEQAKIVPTFISDMQVNLAEGDNYIKTMKRMKVLSEEFGTSVKNDGSVII